VNVAEAESPLEPVTVIVYTPDATLATMNEPLSVPPEIEQLSDAITTPPVNEQVASPDENPTPETRTVDPTVADVGLSVTDAVTEGAVTVNVAEAESPEDPVTVIVYTPTATLATRNEAVNVPLEIVQVWEAMKLPDNEQVISLGENPEPDTRTVDPT
jgi:hypothetical protein